MLSLYTNGAESGSCCTCPVLVCKSYLTGQGRVVAPRPIVVTRESRTSVRCLATAAPSCNLIRLRPFFEHVFRQSCFRPLLLAGFQVEGVTLDHLNNVFLLHLAPEPTQCVFEGLALLKSDFFALLYDDRS